MSPISTHGTALKPSPFLAVLCLAVVHRVRPDWVALPISHAAAQEGISAQRVCRLAAAAIGAFEQILARLTRIGRPPIDREADDDFQNLGLTRALLELATSILSQVSLRRRRVVSLIVGAWERLKASHPTLTIRRFCQTLALPERTFRAWKKSAVRPTVEPIEEPSSPVRPIRPPRRPRFGFEAMLPGTQLAADTTDLMAFGVRLKLMAAQDVGGRDVELLEAVLVDDHESADRIASVVAEALSGEGGEQLITDQGTPYMAEALRVALEELEVEHAPQVEGDPLGKATIERAFGIVKALARPLLALTNRIARRIPSLAIPPLAKGATQLVLTMLLKAYQAGARAHCRAAEARGGVDAAEIARLAQDSRERARSDDRSKRLLLGHVHEAYDMGGSKDQFVRIFRPHPLRVLEAANRSFQGQAHRDDIANRWSYFAALVHRHHEDYRRTEARLRRDEQEACARRRADREHQARQRCLRDDPAAWLFEALEMLACQWNAALGTLLFGGLGAGLGIARAALARLLEIHGIPAGLDIARGVMRRFANASSDQLDATAVEAACSVVEDLLGQLTTLQATDSLTAEFVSAILGRNGPSSRPDPPSSLRTLAAERGGS